MPKGDRSNKISIVFDKDRCLHARTVKSSCSFCVDTCPSGAIYASDSRGTPAVEPMLCMSCGQCLSACPLDAFSSPQFTERQLLRRIDRTQAVRLRCFLPYGELEALDLSRETYHLGTCIAALSAGCLVELAMAHPCELATDQCSRCVLFRRVLPTMRHNVLSAARMLADWGRAKNLVESKPLFLWDEEDGSAGSVDMEGFEPAAAETVREQAVAEGHRLGLVGPSGEERNRFADGAKHDADSENAGGADDSAESENNAGLVATDASEAAAETSFYVDAADAVESLEDVRASIRTLFHGRAKRASGGLLPRPELRVRRYKEKHVPLWRDRLHALWSRSTAAGSGHFLWPQHIVNTDVCRACGVCMQMCPTGSIQHTLGDGEFVYEFVPGTCVGCGVCVASCPMGAISRRRQALTQPFYSQECYAMKAEPCPRCGLPVLERDPGPLCCVCASQPDPRAFERTLSKQLGAKVTSGPVGECASSRYGVSNADGRSGRNVVSGSDAQGCSDGARNDDHGSGGDLC